MYQVMCSWKQDTMVSSSQPNFIRSVSGGDSRSAAFKFQYCDLQIASEDIFDECYTVGV